ncbi:MAG: hypothetical protein LUD69_04155 [Oscillospiraceae bacterium]|nr:hypothetical protein [Oscillospiraceae bacterium]
MARNFATKEGAKVQAYCMYVKLLQRTFGGKVPPAAAGAFNQYFLKSARAGGRRFWFRKRRKSAGILDVCQAFATHSWAERFCQTPQAYLISVSLEA